MTSPPKPYKGHTHDYTVSDAADTLAGYEEFTNWPKDHEAINYKSGGQMTLESMIQQDRSFWNNLPIAADDDDDFSGLMTLRNTMPAKSAQLTFEDLKKAMDEFPTMDEELFARQQRVLLNQNKWANLIACELGAGGRSQRIKDIFMFVRLGADFDVYSRNVGLNFYNWPSPRFVWLRRQLYKATIGRKV